MKTLKLLCYFGLVLPAICLVWVRPAQAMTMHVPNSYDLCANDTCTFSNSTLRVFLEEACREEGDDDIDFDLWSPNRPEDGHTITLDAPLVIPSDCRGRVTIRGRNGDHGVDVTLRRGRRVPEGSCLLSVGSDNNVIQDINIIGAGKGLCVQGNNNQILRVYAGAKRASGAVLANRVGMEISGNHNQLAQNVVVSNSSHGIVIIGRNNQLSVNYIGTTPANEQLPVAQRRNQNGNGGDGVHIEGSRNVIGGSPQLKNWIAFNRGNGIALIDRENVAFNDLGYNSLYANTGLGIDIGPNGVNPNEGCVGGANGCIPYPREVTNFRARPQSYMIRGLGLEGTEVQVYLVASGDQDTHGEGQVFLGKFNIPAGDPWQWRNFSYMVVNPNLQAGVRLSLLSAKLIPRDGTNTSEFSETITLQDTPPPGIEEEEDPGPGFPIDDPWSPIDPGDIVVEDPGIHLPNFDHCPGNPDIDHDAICDDRDEGPVGTDTDGDGTPDAGDADSDGDGINDADEAGDANIDTRPIDTDGDGTPDFRDTDSDNDAVLDEVEGTVDTDGDGTPDYLDTDSDGDGVLDGPNDPDNCRLVPNAGQADSDGDGIGNLCDDTPLGDEHCPGPPEAIDIDDDFICDAVDEGPLGKDWDEDGTADAGDTDSDNDTILDVHEEGDHDIKTPPIDSDGDGVPDFRDGDSDNDGVPDLVEAGDNNPQTPPVDTDHDGLPDFRDPDSDGDGDLDGPSVGPDGEGIPPDNCRLIPNPDQSDRDGDGLGDACDQTPDGGPRCDGATGDLDQDRICDEIDEGPPGLDTDHDTTPDAGDLDSDNDNIPDQVEGGDADLDTPPIDTDGDGIPDFRDPDSDNDGVPDSDEGQIDTDHDAVPDYVDPDSDGDGVSDGPNNPDNCRVVPNQGQADSDGDGIGDVCDPTPNGPPVVGPPDDGGVRPGDDVAAADGSLLQGSGCQLVQAKSFEPRTRHLVFYFLIFLPFLVQVAGKGNKLLLEKKFLQLFSSGRKRRL